MLKFIFGFLTLFCSSTVFGSDAGESEPGLDPNYNSLGVAKLIKIRRSLSEKICIFEALCPLVQESDRTPECIQCKNSLSSISRRLRLRPRYITCGDIQKELKEKNLKNSELFFKAEEAFVKAALEAEKKCKEEFFKAIDADIKTRLAKLTNPEAAKKAAEWYLESMEVYYIDRIIVWNAQANLEFCQGRVAQFKKKYNEEYDRIRKNHGPFYSEDDFKRDTTGTDVNHDLEHAIEGLKKDAEQQLASALKRQQESEDAFVAKWGAGEVKAPIIHWNDYFNSEQYKSHYDFYCKELPAMMYAITSNRPVFNGLDLKEAGVKLKLEVETKAYVDARQNIIKELLCIEANEIVSLVQSLGVDPSNLMKQVE